MKALVLYDSSFGNTKHLAEVIAAELGKEAETVFIENADPAELSRAELLIIGSPIQGFRPTEKMNKFLTHLKPGQLNGVKATTFDTRVKVWIHGNAADPMAHQLKRAGAEIICKQEYFYVEGKEGPIFPGEVERAITWANQIKEIAGLK